MTSGMVSNSSLPDRPSRRGGFGRGFSAVGCSSVTDTISALSAYHICLRPLAVFRMRFASGSVKLRIAHVSRFRIDCTRRRAAILPSKNTAKINIFAQIAPFRRTPAAASDKIDENGSLPYKPRQLSAMARFDRGGSFWAGNGPLWAGQHWRTDLINQAELPGQRSTTRETDLSTQQTGA